MKIRWDDDAKLSLKQAYVHIRQDSLKNAEKVKKDILKEITDLLHHPLKYPADKYKLDNDGNFRAFEKHHYRISYFVSKKEIRILDIRHSSMEPRDH